MNKKNKLMRALVGLELSNKAKQEFCDIVLDKSDNESGDGDARIVYVKAANLPEGAASMLLSLFSVISAVNNNGTIYIMPPATATNMFPDAEIVGVGYMPDMEVILSNGRVTIAETFAESGVTEDVLATAIITKEEFYNLE